ncbi:MAG: metallophosphoesterase [Eubacteriales bacterium]|jgi:predicted MPP superfamily phosphohydrolase
MKKKLLFCAATLLTAQGIISNECLKTTFVEFAHPNIPASFNGFKILQLSDLHSKTFGAGNYRLVKKIRREHPDILVLTGDMINSRGKNNGVFYSLVTALKNIAPVYYVMGNHELQLTQKEYHQLMHFLNKQGVIILDNEAAELKQEDDSILLYGLWFNLRYYSPFISGKKPYDFSAEIMDTLLGVSDSSRFNLLLTHDPSYFDTYAKWGAHLTLSGHIHGGMIRLPFKGGVFSPHREFFPAYCSGLYRYGESRAMFVHSGLGRGRFGLRCFNRPEIAVITLKHLPSSPKRGENVCLS